MTVSVTGFYTGDGWVIEHDLFADYSVNWHKYRSRTLSQACNYYRWRTYRYIFSILNKSIFSLRIRPLILYCPISPKQLIIWNFSHIIYGYIEFWVTIITEMWPLYFLSLNLIKIIFAPRIIRLTCIELNIENINILYRMSIFT